MIGANRASLGRKGECGYPCINFKLLLFPLNRARRL